MFFASEYYYLEIKLQDFQTTKPAISVLFHEYHTIIQYATQITQLHARTPLPVDRLMQPERNLIGCLMESALTGHLIFQ